MGRFHRELTEAEEKEMRIVKCIDGVLNVLLVLAVCALGYAIYRFEPPMPW